MADIKLKHMSTSQRFEFWKHHVRAWHESNLTQIEYCRQNDLAPNSLTNWKKKILGSQQAQQQTLVKLPIKKESAPRLEIEVNNKVKIKVVDNFDPELLIKVLKALGAL
jgi:hypothetical protein